MKFLILALKTVIYAAYAAGPGSYTGARLAYTFLDTIKLVANCDFYAFSNLSALKWNNDSMTPVIKGNKNDYFYKVNEKEMYCKNFKEIPENHDFVSYSSEIPELNNVKKLEESEIASNILEMMLDSVENALESNYPNYIKSLITRKLMDDLSLIQIIILSIIQAITEFLPISSSAHLLLPSKLLGWPDQGIIFDITVHFASLLAVIVYFRDQFLKFSFLFIKNIHFLNYCNSSNCANSPIYRWYRGL